MVYTESTPGQLEQSLRAFQQLGIQVQARPKIRDVEDDIMAIIESIQLNRDYVVLVQQLWNLCGTALPYVSDPVKKEIEDLMADEKAAMPTFATEVTKAGMEGTMLSVRISRAADTRSTLPMDSATHFGILMERQFLVAHYNIYTRLIRIKGKIEKDLEALGIIPKKSNVDPPKVELELANAERKK